MILIKLLYKRKSLEENELGWAVCVNEFFKKDFFISQWNNSEIFSEASHEELTTLLWETEFVRFLSFDVVVHVKRER